MVLLVFFCFRWKKSCKRQCFSCFFGFVWKLPDTPQSSQTKSARWLHLFMTLQRMVLSRVQVHACHTPVTRTEFHISGIQLILSRSVRAAPPPFSPWSTISWWSSSRPSCCNDTTSNGAAWYSCTSICSSGSCNSHRSAYCGVCNSRASRSNGAQGEAR